MDGLDDIFDSLGDLFSSLFSDSTSDSIDFTDFTDVDLGDTPSIADFAAGHSAQNGSDDFYSGMDNALNELFESQNTDLQEHASISFGGNLGNRYDQNTIDFLEECKSNNVELPTSVDHSNSSSSSIVDRSVDGGLTSIDKSIIRDRLDNLHNSGSISDSVYNKLKSKLSSS